MVWRIRLHALHAFWPSKLVQQCYIVSSRLQQCCAFKLSARSLHDIKYLEDKAITAWIHWSHQHAVEHLVILFRLC